MYGLIINRRMQSRNVLLYERFMDTRTYKNYQKNFEEFQEKNPSYKESLNKRFSQSANEI